MPLNLRKYFEPAFDPRRIDENTAEYDQRRGYAAYHAHCRAQAPVTKTASSPTLQGFEVLPGLVPPARAVTLREHVIAAAEFSLLKKNARDLHGYRLRDRAQIADLFAAVLRPDVDALARNFLGCEYLVHWMTVAATQPSKQPSSISFRWHCDKGPTEHLKLMVYLNDAEEHGGGTAFLPPRASAAVAATGYLFGRAKKRTVDLATLAQRAGQPLTAVEVRAAAGDAVLFQPTTVVHRGITPTRGPRYVLTLCLLPSPVPWAEALNCGTLSDLMEDELWHADAATLLQLMQRRDA